MKRNLEEPEIEPIAKRRKVEVQTFQEESSDQNYFQDELIKEITDTLELSKDFNHGQFITQYPANEQFSVDYSSEVNSQSSLNNQIQSIGSNYAQPSQNMYMQPSQYNQIQPLAGNYLQSSQNMYAQPSQYNQMQPLASNYSLPSQNVYAQPSQYNQMQPTSSNLNQRLESFMVNAKFEQKISNYISANRKGEINMFIKNLLSSEDIELVNFAINTYTKLSNSCSNRSTLQHAIRNKHEDFVNLILKHCNIENMSPDDHPEKYNILELAILSKFNNDTLCKIIKKYPNLIQTSRANDETILNLIVNSYADKDMANEIMSEICNKLDTADIFKAIKIERTKGVTTLIQEKIRDDIIYTFEDIAEDEHELTNPESRQKIIENLCSYELRCIKLLPMINRGSFKCNTWKNFDDDEASINLILDFAESHGKFLLRKDFFKYTGVCKSLMNSPIEVIAYKDDIMGVIIEFLAPYSFWPELNDRVVEITEEEVTLTGEEVALN